jgi:hypothetical protein
VFVLAASLFLSAAAVQPLNVPKSVPPEVAAERVRACGFDHVQVKDDQDLQEDVVEVSGVIDVPERKLRCVAQVSLDTVRYVIFPDPVNGAYQRLYFQMDENQGDTVGWVTGDARAWLKQRGLLDKVPHYRKGTDDSLGFAHALENVCGSKARGALVLFDRHLILRPSAPGQQMIDHATFECLFNAITASGMPFGFVGKESYEKK